MNKLMNCGRLGVLALAVWAAGIIPAAATQVTETTNFKILWPTNSGATTNFVFDITTLPSFEPSNHVRQVEIFALGTDGAGKIEGTAFMRVGFDDSVTNYADLIVGITGSLGNKNKDTSIKLTLKGTGASQDLSKSKTGTAGLNLKYSGTVTQGLTAVFIASYVATVTTNEATGLTTTNILGYETNSPLVNPPDDRVPLGTNWVVGYYTNSLVQVDRHFVMGGEYNGSINSGISGVKLPHLTKSPGQLSSGAGSWMLDTAGTNLVFVPALPGLEVESLDLAGKSVRLGNKLYVAGNAPFDFSGGGNVNQGQNTYKATIAGLAFGRGSNMTLNGDLAFTTNVVVVSLNPPVSYEVLVFVPGTAKATGKVQGQRVNLDNGVGFPVPANPNP